MDFWFITCGLFLLIIVYLITLPEHVDKELYKETTPNSEKKDPDTDPFAPKLIYIKNRQNEYLCLDKLTRFFFFDKNIASAETFKLSHILKQLSKEKQELYADTPSKLYHKNKISLQSSDGYFLSLKYTTFPKEQYNVSAITRTFNNNCLLTLSSFKKYFYAKFYNGHFLSIDAKNTLFTSKKKSNTLFFKIKLKTEKKVDET